ncbi:DUF7768 domain-containing protein [Leucobacter sp. HY1910]
MNTAPPLVVIESPYAGATALHERYARACLADSLTRGEAPFASHLLYTQPGVLDDTVPGERTRGIEAGFTWGAHAQYVACYTDLGVSPGMVEGRRQALARGQRVITRSIGLVWAETDRGARQVLEVPVPPGVVQGEACDHMMSSLRKQWEALHAPTPVERWEVQVEVTPQATGLRIVTSAECLLPELVSHLTRLWAGAALGELT